MLPDRCPLCNSKVEPITAAALAKVQFAPEKFARNKAMYDDRQLGLTFVALGKKYGVTTPRARGIVLRYQTKYAGREVEQIDHS